MFHSELPKIDAQKVDASRKVLDDLVTQTIISGYNWYGRVPSYPRVITFSHMHENADYRGAMKMDMIPLGYSSEIIDNNTREKYGCYRWEKDFIFRDAQGIIFPDLRIRKLTGDYINLNKCAEQTLANVLELQNELLIGENKGWELDIEFSSKEKLLQLIKMFLSKSSRHNPNHWPGAYDVPVLIIGEKAKAYSSDLPDFVEAKKIALIENGNEISFIIHNRFGDLIKRPIYSTLQQLSFREEICLGNKSFVEEYVDKR